MLKNLFKKKPAEGESKRPEMLDADFNPLQEGDLVEALRYDLGKCRIVVEQNHFHYESLTDGRKVIWVRMIDAVNQTQKVKKIEE